MVLEFKMEKEPFWEGTRGGKGVVGDYHGGENSKRAGGRIRESGNLIEMECIHRRRLIIF